MSQPGTFSEWRLLVKDDSSPGIYRKWDSLLVWTSPESAVLTWLTLGPGAPLTGSLTLSICKMGQETRVYAGLSPCQALRNAQLFPTDHMAPGGDKASPIYGKRVSLGWCMRWIGTQTQSFQTPQLPSDILRV